VGNAVPSRRTQLAVVLTIAAIAACGCGASGDPLRRVVDAANKTLAVPSATYDVNLDKPRLFGPSIDVLGGRAAYDLTAGIGYEALSVQSQNGAKRTIYLDFLPAAVYVAPWPTPAGLLPAGKIWIAVDFAGSGARKNRALASQAEGLAPELALDEIAWGAGAASHVGTRVIGHVPMEEYRVSVDLAKALSAAARTRRVAVAAAIERELRATKTGRASFTVLVTGAGHIGRIEQTVQGSGLGKASFSFTSFHARFNRNAPRPSQAVPLGSITQPRFLWTIATHS
jgi:hypothetical protein